MIRPVLIFAPIAAALIVVFGYTAWRSALLLERWEADRLTADLAAAGQGWARVEADGLTLRAAGTAPDDAALSAAAAIVETRRWSEMSFDIPDPIGTAAGTPEIALTFLRDGDKITITGAHPADGTRELIAGLADMGEVENVGERVEAPAPPGWRAALDYALFALRETPQSRVVLRPGSVAVEGAVASAEIRDQLEARLRAAKPPSSALELSISAPPPALSPYRFAAAKSEGVAEVQACAAESAAQRAEIAAAVEGALGVAPDCALALGAPSADWASAVAAGVRALAAIPAGRFELADSEAQLIAARPTAPGAFDTALRDLALALSSSYSLVSAPPPGPAPEIVAETPPEADADPADPAPASKLWFRARSRDGRLRLDGEAPDDATRGAILTYARALEGAMAVEGALADAAEPAPEGWRRAALAGLEALAPLDSGEAVFDGASLRVAGRTETPELIAAITAKFAPRIAEGLAVRSEIAVDQTRLAARIPFSPAQCVAALSGEVAREPINFEPGGAGIDAENLALLDRLAAILARCDGQVIEIGGHTDSQGRESTNLALSQARAEAVLDALLARGVSLRKLVATGYGEADPIADNGTESGRARNRRIEFSAADEAAE